MATGVWGTKIRFDEGGATGQVTVVIDGRDKSVIDVGFKGRLPNITMVPPIEEILPIDFYSLELRAAVIKDVGRAIETWVPITISQSINQTIVILKDSESLVARVS